MMELNAIQLRERRGPLYGVWFLNTLDGLADLPDPLAEK